MHVGFSKTATTLIKLKVFKPSIAHGADSTKYCNATHNAQCVEPAFAAYLLFFQLALCLQIQIARLQHLTIIPAPMAAQCLLEKEEAAAPVDMNTTHVFDLHTQFHQCKGRRFPSLLTSHASHAEFHQQNAFCYLAWKDLLCWKDRSKP